MEALAILAAILVGWILLKVLGGGGPDGRGPDDQGGGP